jgi:glycosyltransferase involved in cell wall biosynthesis
VNHFLLITKPNAMPTTEGKINTIQSDAINDTSNYSEEGNRLSGQTIQRLSIIIPAYNEENTIGKILDRINEVKLIRNIEKEVIVVNDCSKDNTEAAIQSYMTNTPDLTINFFKYIKHDVNQGKGAAIHTGIAQATGDYLLVQDADLEYDPGEYNTLLKPIVLGSADVVYGSRFMGGNPHRILFFWCKPGKGCGDPHRYSPGNRRLPVGTGC